jgi:hypothetical protein
MIKGLHGLYGDNFTFYRYESNELDILMAFYLGLFVTDRVSNYLNRCVVLKFQTYQQTILTYVGHRRSTCVLTLRFRIVGISRLHPPCVVRSSAY